MIRATGPQMTRSVVYFHAVAVVIAACIAPIFPVPAGAQVAYTAVAEAAPPFVAGGHDDEPHLRGLFGRIAVGGYAELHAVWQREDGATVEAGFLLKRWNLLTSTRVSDHVQVWAEVEFEEGGKEVRVELAQIDFLLHHTFNLRGGMLLVPLGRFNLAHDAPRNEFTDRPLVATDLIGTALAMPGLGIFGRIPTGTRARATYELYAVNGFDAGIIDISPDGTRLTEGGDNVEDNNASPSGVSRVAWFPAEEHEIGLSAFTGAYNVFRIEGLDVDERRMVRIGAIDARSRFLGLEWNGEAAIVEVEIPPGLGGIFASRQSGFFLETRRVFGRRWIRPMPAASFSAALRAEGVDFDRDLAGDSRIQLTGGLHFRPTPETVFKLDYARGRNRARFNNPVETAALKFSLASYF